jgi:hypothetical protein
VVSGLVLLACGDSGPARTTAPAVLSFEPGLEPGRRLAGYSWDGRARIPWLSDRPPEHLFYGEIGRDADTALYLTFNHGPSSEAELQAAGWELGSSRLAACAGRFGQGVRLDRDSVLRCTIPERSAPLQAWTVEFWLRPEQPRPGRSSDLLAVPDVLAVTCTPEGRLRLEIPGAGESGPEGRKPLVFVHPQALAAGQWHHVGVVLDLLDLRAARLVIDGEPHGQRLDPACVQAEPRALLLGDGRGLATGLAFVLDELCLRARNTSTAELARHFALERRAVQRLRLHYADGGAAGDTRSEELELWREPQAEARIDSVEEWRRGELVHACASTAGLTWTPEHWRALDIAGPVARTTHPVVSLGGRRVFTFGGETRDTHWGRVANTDDTWIFDGAAERWARVPTPVAPFPRCHMPAAYSPDHDLVLLVGGWWQGGWWTDAPETQFDDTWVYHVSEQRWEQRFPAGADLPAIGDNGLVYLPEQRRFLLFLYAQARLYDPDADRWEARAPFTSLDQHGRPAQGVMAISRTCERDPASGRLLLFGGSYGPKNDAFCDETAMYDVDANTLTVLDPPVRPAARVRTALAYDPVRARFVLFGGGRDQDTPRFDDLWTFDPRTGAWSEVERGAERPSGRGGFFGMAYDAVADHFVLACGRSGKERWQDETWVLELDERRAGVARYLFDRAAFPEARAWFADVDAESGAGVRFRFRASADGRVFGAWSEECPAEGRFLQVEVVLEPGPGGAKPLVRAMGFRGPT